MRPPDRARGQLRGTRFFYADTYDLLGHFQRYLLIDDATKEWLAILPRN